MPFSTYLTPETIEKCRAGSRILAPIPGIKTTDGNWETFGASRPLIQITEDVLGKIAQACSKMSVLRQPKPAYLKFMGAPFCL